MNRSINVILLDDEADKILPDLKLSAKSERVLIKETFTNAKEGIEYIKSNHKKIDAIILDGLFLAEPGSSQKKDLNALKQTVEALKKLLYKEDIRIPFCVLTGYLEDISDDSLLSDIKVFRKGRGNKEMFEYLKSEVAKSPEFQIKSKFEEVFVLFDDRLLPEDKENDLVHILKKLDSKAKYNKDDAFNPVRKMYEVFIGSLHEQAYSKNKKQDIVPIELFDRYDESLNITGSSFYLSGHPVKKGDTVIIESRGEAVWPEHVAALAKMLVEITHQNSHDYPEDIHHYTYKSVVYALLELLLWYKNFIKNYS
ncbi:MAG: hypothetical protein GVY20_14400 [Bacteroidetes bacterium]|jgi:hypothetical protein|nr:hypothetical protein [Bacteroidota bacterium]